MRNILYIIEKEFKHILRNRSILPAIFVAPMIQLIIMPLAADYEIKNINLAIVSGHYSPETNHLIQKITGSGFFRLVKETSSFEEGKELIEKDQADLVLQIPNDLEENLVKEKKGKVLIFVNAINGTKANIGATYLSSILKTYNVEFIQKEFGLTNPVDLRYSNWYNKHMNYPFFIVPGVLVTLITMIGAYMCALNIVKEKELGTIEQINVTPIKKHEFILGKLIPFWMIGFFVFSVGFFFIGMGIYGIRPLGSILLLYMFLAVFLVAVLGLGLLISTYSQTQQQAMSVAFFFMMIFMLMSGLFTPIESMPNWAITMAKFNPVAYFIEVMRMVVLKGSSFADISGHLLKMLGFAIFFNSWAVWNYRKTV
jgi:ABC-2 type transport system permease protein